MLTETQLKELIELGKQATPRPWESPLKDLGAIPSFQAVDFYFDHSFEAYPPLGETGPVFVASSKEAAAYIAASANSADELAAEVLQLRAEVTRLRGLTWEEVSKTWRRETS